MLISAVSDTVYRTGLKYPAIAVLAENQAFSNFILTLDPDNPHVSVNRLVSVYADLENIEDLDTRKEIFKVSLNHLKMLTEQYSYSPFYFQFYGDFIKLGQELELLEAKDRDYLEQWSRSVELHPGYYSAYSRLNQYFREKGDFSTALEYQEKGLAWIKMNERSTSIQYLIELVETARSLTENSGRDYSLW